jgi:chromate transporter
METLMIVRLASLAILFAHLSLFAVGGANSVIAAMHHDLVAGHGWLDGQLFASLIAIAQASPGPNAMVVGLSGWHVAGALGASVATVAFCGPPALITIALGRVWHRVRASRVGPCIIEGVAPLTVGLLLASAWSLVRAQGFHAETLAITGLATLVATVRVESAGWLLVFGAGVAVALG